MRFLRIGFALLIFCTQNSIAQIPCAELEIYLKRVALPYYSPKEVLAQPVELRISYLQSLIDGARMKGMNYDELMAARFRVAINYFKSSGSLDSSAQMSQLWMDISKVLSEKAGWSQSVSRGADQSFIFIGDKGTKGYPMLILSPSKQIYRTNYLSFFPDHREVNLPRGWSPPYEDPRLQEIRNE